MSNDDEQNYRTRSRWLYEAALAETDPTLQLTLLTLSEQVGAKAIALELARKQATLKAWGVPVDAEGST